MSELEKLYESAGRHLAASPQQWPAFAKDFQSIFGGGVVLYRPSFANGVLAWRSAEQIVATTHLEYALNYVQHQVFESNQIPDGSLNPLEPSRRSDIIPDAIFRNSEVAKNFFIPRGIFYMLAVSAILSDETHLMMVVWRSEEEGNFSDIEKQRIALFMRYLATLIPIENKEEVENANDAVEEFGMKYALTGAEVDVLSDLLKGKSLKAIADESERSYGTVRWHVQNILEKCQVKSQKNLLREFYGLIKR